MQGADAEGRCAVLCNAMPMSSLASVPKQDWMKASIRQTVKPSGTMFGYQHVFVHTLEMRNMSSQQLHGLRLRIPRFAWGSIINYPDQMCRLQSVGGDFICNFDVVAPLYSIVPGGYAQFEIVFSASGMTPCNSVVGYVVELTSDEFATPVRAIGTQTISCSKWPEYYIHVPWYKRWAQYVGQLVR